MNPKFSCLPKSSQVENRKSKRILNFHALLRRPSKSKEKVPGPMGVKVAKRTKDKTFKFKLQICQMDQCFYAGEKRNQVYLDFLENPHECRSITPFEPHLQAPKRVCTH